jgi:hypothetical protein
MMLRKIFSRQPPTADRRRRLMGGLVDIFDHLEGRTWATLLGVFAVIVLVAVSFLPM